MSSYYLRTDLLGRKRLDLQGKLYDPGSRQFLLKQGIKKGQSVLEVGCGSGAMSLWLAEQVGKHGRVLCIDNSAAQIQATQRRVIKAGFTQVECRELSVFDLNQVKEKFDIIYARCLLLHLNEPFIALTQMYNRLKKKGRIVIDEMLNSCNFCYPPNPAFDKRRYCMEQFFLKNGLNPNFGLTVKPMLQKLKLKNIEESLFQPTLRTPSERRLLTLIFQEVKEKFFSLKILNQFEWAQLVKSLEAMQKDKNYFIALSSLYQICAEK